jgi:hypothetical protein
LCCTSLRWPPAGGRGRLPTVASRLAEPLFRMRGRCKAADGIGLHLPVRAGTSRRRGWFVAGATRGVGGPNVLQTPGRVGPSQSTTVSGCRPWKDSPHLSCLALPLNTRQTRCPPRPSTNAPRATWYRHATRARIQQRVQGGPCWPVQLWSGVGWGTRAHPGPRPTPNPTLGAPGRCALPRCKGTKLPYSRALFAAQSSGNPERAFTWFHTWGRLSSPVPS